MRTTIDADLLPVDLSLGARKARDTMTTTDRSSSSSRINSNQSEGDDEEDSVLNDGTFIPSSSPSSISVLPSSDTSFDDEIDYLTEFVCPTDSGDEQSYFSDENNDDCFLDNHLSRTHRKFVDDLQTHVYHRSKRSHKKMNARRQIKSKHAKSIQINSHNQHLYIHHRLAKKISLDPPSDNHIPSSPPIPPYSTEDLRELVRQYRHARYPSYVFNSTPSRTHRTNEVHHHHHHHVDEESRLNLAIYQEFTLNEYNIPDEPSYDDTMVDFLLDMQNRDLSPEDYEMLLRLDERVGRKTINTNVIDTLPTHIVNENDLEEQCTICIDTYILGQELKLLPCGHRFHSNCIETHLKEFSTQCPLDNLPLL